MNLHSTPDVVASFDPVDLALPDRTVRVQVLSTPNLRTIDLDDLDSDDLLEVSQALENRRDAWFTYVASTSTLARLQAKSGFAGRRSNARPTPKVGFLTSGVLPGARLPTPWSTTPRSCPSSTRWWTPSKVPEPAPTPLPRLHDVSTTAGDRGYSR
jgi:hypothetical protein